MSWKKKKRITDFGSAVNVFDGKHTAQTVEGHFGQRWDQLRGRDQHIDAVGPENKTKNIMLNLSAFLQNRKKKSFSLFKNRDSGGTRVTSVVFLFVSRRLIGRSFHNDDDDDESDAGIRFSSSSWHWAVGTCATDCPMSKDDPSYHN